MLLRICGLAWVLALASAVPLKSYAFELGGRLEVEVRTTRNDSKQTKDSYWEEGNGVLPIQGSRQQVPEEIVVALVAQDRAVNSTSPALTTIKGYRFSPVTMVAPPQGRIDISNEDNQSYHLASSKGGSVVIGLGSTKSVTASTQGLSRFCDQRLPFVCLHLWAVPKIVAVHYMKDNFGFLFKDLQEGAYNLRVYHLAKMVHQQRVIVNAASVDKRNRKLKRVELDAIALKLDAQETN